MYLNLGYKPNNLNRIISLANQTITLFKNLGCINGSKLTRVDFEYAFACIHLASHVYYT